MSNMTGHDFTKLTLGEIEQARAETQEKKRVLDALAKEKKRAQRAAASAAKRHEYAANRWARMTPEAKQAASVKRAKAQKLARHMQRFFEAHHPEAVKAFYAAQGSKSEVEAEGANT